MPETNLPSALQQWAILELFGRQRIAGAITEHPFGGGLFVRVDVPGLDISESYFDRDRREWATRTVHIPAHTSSFSPSSIYTIHWCDEASVRAVAATIKHRPISAYTMRDAIAALPEAERTRLLALGAPTADEA